MSSPFTKSFKERQTESRTIYKKYPIKYQL